MLPKRLKNVVVDNPKKVANLIDLVNLPNPLKEFMGQSQSSQLNCFRRVWSYIKDKNLQTVGYCGFISHSLFDVNRSELERFTDFFVQDDIRLPLYVSFAGIERGEQMDPSNKNIVNCDERLKSILLGNETIDLTELPRLIKLHFPKQPK